MSIPEKTEYEALEIRALQKGGYVVMQAQLEPGDIRAMLAAFADLNDAIKWVRMHMIKRNPVPPPEFLSAFTLKERD